MDVENSSSAAPESNRPDDSEFTDIVISDPSEPSGSDSGVQDSGSEKTGESSGSESEPSNKDKDGKPVSPAKPDSAEKPNSFQERIDELTRRRHEAEREAAYWRSRVEATQSDKPEEPKPVTRPKRDDFESDEAYQDALIEFGAKKVVSESEAQRATREEQEAQQRAAQAAAQIWSEKVDAARAKFADYETVMDAADVIVKPHVANALTQMDEGADLIYHLAKAPEVVEKLNGLTFAKATLELVKFAQSVGVVQVESKSGGESGGKPSGDGNDGSGSETPSRKVSSAPAPARVSGSGKQSVQPNIDDMSMEDYVAMRKKQGASWVR